MVHTLFRPRFRHPLARALFALAGALALAGLVVFGLFTAIALTVVGGLVWLVRQFVRPAAPRAAATRPSPPSGVIEGEFVVLRDEETRRNSV